MADTQFKYDVFISYSHADEKWVVDTLLPALESAGLKVCIDFRDFEAGKPAAYNMQNAAKESRHVLIAASQNWLSGEWTHFEVFVALHKNPSGSNAKIIPLLIETGIEKKLPEMISIFSWVDFTRKDREAIAWKQLFTALGKPDAKIPVANPQESAENTPASWFLAHPYGMPPNFTGRESERKMLTEWLLNDSQHPMLILRALGGFGKSALAWYWLTHDVPARQFIKVVFWSFYEGDASFDNFVKETLQYFGVLNAGQLSQYDQTNLLLNYLRNPGVLLILDGFERVLRAYGSMGAAYQGDEIQNDDSQDTSRDCINMLADGLLRSVGAYGGMLKGKVLMTTRLTPRAVMVGATHASPLQGIREEELRAMHKDDAVEFFQAQGIRGTHTEIENACEPYGYHPLSLRILSGYIVNDRTLPGDIAAARHLEITKDIIQNKHHILEVGFDSLSAAQKKLLGRIACFRAAMDYEALKALAEDGRGESPTRPYVEFDDDLKTLESRGLLHWDRKTNKYDLHPIVRRFAYDHLTAADRTGAHERLVNYFEAVPKPERVEKLEDLAPVIELYHHTVRAGKLDEAVKLFHDRINKPTYYQFGAYQLRIELLHALFLDGEDKPPRLKDESAQAWILNGLANSYSMSGQPRRAVPLYEMHNNLREKAENKKNLAIGLGNVAQQQLVIGVLSEAERNLRRSIDLCREIEDEFNEAVGHQDLGRVLSYRGAWGEAEQALDKGLELFLKVRSTKDWISKYWAYRSQLAGVTGKSYDALQFAQEALKFSIQDANEDYPVERDFIRDYWLLGAAYRANNELDKAEENLTKALNQCRQIDMVDHEADILLDIARLRYAQGDFKDALEKASEALVITERSGYVLQGADVNIFLATLALEGYKLQVTSDLSDKDAAIFHAKEAKKLATGWEEIDGKVVYDTTGKYVYKVAYDEAEAMLEKLK
jgi:tetratricopeptide (TPR) repeat protein